MMAKQGYKIPASLNQTHFDRMINLSKNPNSPIGLVSVKTIAAYIGTLFFVGSLFKMGMFVGNGFFFNVFYVILIFLFVSQLINTLPTGELKYMNINALIDYLPKQMRFLKTTRNSNVDAFYKLYGIAKVKDNGDILYKNGDVGTLLSVSGSGSILVFDEDKNAILDATDTFWRKIDVGMYITQITIKEGQKVDLQLGNYQHRWNTLANSDIDDETMNIIGDLMDAEVNILANDISMNYRSIQQYWLLRTSNDELLKSMKTLIQHDIDNGSLILKSARTQYMEDIVRMSESIFK